MSKLPRIFSDIDTLGYDSPKTKTPWVRDGYIYKASGIMAVRMKANKDLDTLCVRPDGAPPPPGTSFFGQRSQYVSEPSPLPSEPVIIPDPETAQVDCDACEGWGSYDCSKCRQDCECEECGGTGKVTAIRQPLMPIRVGHAILRATVVKVLQDNAAVVYCQRGAKAERVWFECGPCEGVAMAIRNPDDE